MGQPQPSWGRPPLLPPVPEAKSSLRLGWVPSICPQSSRSVKVRAPWKRCLSISNPLLAWGQCQENSGEAGHIFEELSWGMGQSWHFLRPLCTRSGTMELCGPDGSLAFLRLAFFVYHVGSENPSCFVILYRLPMFCFPTGQPLGPAPSPLIKACF